MLPVAVQHAHSRRQTQAAGFCHDGMPVESMAIQALRHDCSPPPGLMAAVTDKIPGSTFLDFAARKTSAARAATPTGPAVTEVATQIQNRCVVSGEGGGKSGDLCRCYRVWPCLHSLSYHAWSLCMP
ncbi:hypothetical protein MCOR27_005068 [Pyricularia oryzae]|nr:hypothetical protein MCOR19_001453 [Pyricularia oryzae]KAI6279604.1 hypothetical protein MCOR27_005068 [Pyricularia oryzae]KAI6328732.1 hypothetical protein MCOR34_000001 [Pyricularia oryzae]KAI6331920.1 hypothetical protein MCOR29_001454 [Pyricularia oryzae]KAI6340007.1 hypothetical protein MCOR28_006855 [Pyricularia oryzae]